MKKNIRTFMYVIFSISLMASFILDELISNGKIKGFFLVNESYISSIFSGILTFSTLSLTVMSIVVGIIDTKIYGLKLKDILSFDSSPVKIVRFVVFSMFMTFFSIVALAFDLCTFISCIAATSIVYTTYVYIMIFNILSNADSARKVVFSEITMQNNNIILNYVVSWTNEYQNAIINNNKYDIKVYSTLLRECIKSENICEDIKNLLPDMFEEVCKFRSLPDSIDLVFKSLGFTNILSTVRDSFEFKTCKDHIERIRYYDDYDMQRLNHLEIINSILKCNNLAYIEKTEILYCFFNAISHNDTVSTNIKNQTLRKYINEITKFNKNNSESKDILSIINNSNAELAKSELIIKIFIYDIIFVDNNLRDTLYDMLLYSLYLNNIFCCNEEYIATIAKIFRAFFFYGTIDTKIFDKESHEKIHALAKHGIIIDGFEITISDLILPHSDRLSKFYINDSIKILSSEEKYHFCKNQDNPDKRFSSEANYLWSTHNRVRYALWFYLAICGLGTEFSISEFLEGEDLNKDYDICNCILEEYDTGKATLNDDCLKHIQCFKKYYNHTVYSTFSVDKRSRKIFDDINTEMRYIDSRRTNPTNTL